MGMYHSRSFSRLKLTEKEATSLNALTNEHLRMAKKKRRDSFRFFIRPKIVERMAERSSSSRPVCFLRVGKRRLEIFSKACAKFKLDIVDLNTENALILIDEELDLGATAKALKNAASSTFVRTQWLSDSIKQNQLVSHESYAVHMASSRPSSSSASSVPESLVSSQKMEKSVVEPPPLKRERSVSSSASDTDDECHSKKVAFLRQENCQMIVAFSVCSMRWM